MTRPCRSRLRLRIVSLCVAGALVPTLGACSDASVDSGNTSEASESTAGNTGQSPEPTAGNASQGQDATTDSETAPRLPRNVVTAGQVEGQEPGTPERALLEWWQAFQFQDVQGVIEMTDPPTLAEAGEEDVARAIRAIGSTLPGLRIVSTAERGDTASLRILLVTFDVDDSGAQLNTSSAKPNTIDMAMREGEWMFAGSTFLQGLVEQAKQAG